MNRTLIISERLHNLKTHFNEKIAKFKNYDTIDFLSFTPSLISDFKNYATVIIDSNFTKIGEDFYNEIILPRIQDPSCKNIFTENQKFVFFDSPAKFVILKKESLQSEKTYEKYRIPIDDISLNSLCGPFFAEDFDIKSFKHPFKKNIEFDRNIEIIKSLFPFTVKEEQNLAPLVTVKIDKRSNEHMFYFSGTNKMIEHLKSYFSADLTAYYHSIREETKDYTVAYISWISYDSPACEHLPYWWDIKRDYIYPYLSTAEKILDNIEDFIKKYPREDAKITRKAGGLKFRIRNLKKIYPIIELIDNRVRLGWKDLPFVKRTKKITSKKYVTTANFCGKNEYKILKVLEKNEGHLMKPQEIHKTLKNTSVDSIRESLRNIKMGIKSSYPFKYKEIFKHDEWRGYQLNLDILL